MLGEVKIMSYISSFLGSAYDTARINSAQSAIINANQGMMDLAGSRGDIKAIQHKEQMLEAQKLRAETEAKAAQARKKALEEKKLNYLA